MECVSIARKTSEEYQGSVVSLPVLDSMRLAKCLERISADLGWNSVVRWGAYFFAASKSPSAMLSSRPSNH